MNKTFLYILVLILCVFNGLFIAKGLKDARSSMFSSLVLPLKKSVVEYSPEKLLNTDIFEIIELGEERFYLITIIQERGCSSCIRDEIAAINAMSDEQLDQLLVVQIGNNETALKDSGLEVDYLFYYSFDSVFNERIDLNSLNPISLVLDKNFIYDVRKVDVTKPKSNLLTQSYYAYIEDIFSH